MPKGSGFTVIELLIVVAIAGILLSLAVPSFSRLIEKQRLRTAVDIFTRSVQLARMQAVYSKHRVCITNKNESWRSGWIVFEDLNSNCQQDDNEPSLFDQSPLNGAFRIKATSHARTYISYLPNGQSTQLSGAFQADSISFCSADKNLIGYKLIIARGGRVRTEEIPAGSATCEN